MSGKRKDFEYVSLPRPRWNIVDLITQAAGPVIPATLFYDIDVSWTENLRKKFAAVGHKVTVTSILLKAIAIAQRKHPASRTVMLPTGSMIRLNNIEAQFTVERFVDGEPAVFFGTIKDPDVKPIVKMTEELQAYGRDEIKDVPKMDLENKFSRFPWLIRQIMIFFGMRIPQIRLMFMGATFGFSSLGKYGCRNLISPAVITSMFCVGEVEERPIAVSGKVEVRPILSLVLNFDHRVLDGATAARFMTDIVKLLKGELEEYLKDELEMLTTNNGHALQMGEAARAI